MITNAIREKINLSIAFLVSSIAHLHVILLVISSYNNNILSSKSSSNINYINNDTNDKGMYAQTSIRAGTGHGNSVPKSFMSFAYKNVNTRDFFNHKPKSSVNVYLIYTLHSGHGNTKSGSVHIKNTGKYDVASTKNSTSYMAVLAHDNKNADSNNKAQLRGLETQSQDYSKYINYISSTIEHVGSQKYNQNIAFNIKVQLDILRNGHLELMQIQRGSGNIEADNIAKDIIKSCFPVKAFPADLYKKYKKLRLIRVIDFSSRT